MKLISLNVEGITHLDKVLPFLETERADVLCLQEAPEQLAVPLSKLGYQTTFAPMDIRQSGQEAFTEGILLASRLPSSARSEYYHRPTEAIVPIDVTNVPGTVARAVIIASVGDYTIATTHFTWSPRGEIASPEQQANMAALLETLAPLPPHILCGDFNIPRQHNPLYTNLTEHYTDTIPAQYKSSLDASLHRHGKNPELKFLFDSFMVDYLFTKGPYSAKNVTLRFGISDHAAVIAHLTKQI